MEIREQTIYGETVITSDRSQVIVNNHQSYSQQKSKISH